MLTLDCTVRAALTALVLAGPLHAQAPGPAVPETARRPVTDVYHGVEVADDYRWLEDWNDPEVKAWSEAQNAAARRYLDSLPDAAAIRRRATQIMTAPSVRHRDVRIAGGDGSGKAGRLLAIRRESGREQPFLVVFDDAAAVLSGGPAQPRTLLDPATEKGASIDWFVPSPDGELVAVSVSLAGTERGDVRVLRVADGSPIGQVVPGVNGGTAGGSLAWTPDSTGFFYTRYPRAGERPDEDADFFVKVYYHELGTPTEQDRYEIGALLPRKVAGRDPASGASRIDVSSREDLSKFMKMESGHAGYLGDDAAVPADHPLAGVLGGALIGFEFPRIAEIVLQSDRRGRVLATVQDGDGGYFAVYLRDPGGYWSRIADYPERVVQSVLGPDDAVYLVSRKEAPRGRLLRLTLPAAGAAGPAPALAEARVIVPEQADTLVSEFFDAANLVVTDTLVYATYQLGGPSEVRCFAHDGTPRPMPPAPAVSAAGGLAPAGDGGDRVVYFTSSYVQPLTWHLVEPGADGPRCVRLEALSTRTTLDTSRYAVTREMARSKDGTMVPVNIVHPAELEHDGLHPCVLTGYGGYGVNIEPYFSPEDYLLLEQGFVLAVANIRGGGEFGDRWHRQGNLENKQNVFDDFAAAARHLIDRGYTSPRLLAIEGGSNGGLLMGAMLTQHPEMFQAVVSHVGIYDMLRVELSANGAFNIPEFGTVKDPRLFEAMYAYSPYHRVRDGVAYPATLLLTGANDPRVDPMQSRKFAARLQAAVRSGAAGSSESGPGGGPILLRTSGDTGHGSGTPLTERIAQTADAAAFIMAQLGVEWKAVGPPGKER